MPHRLYLHLGPCGKGILKTLTSFVLLQGHGTVLSCRVLYDHANRSKEVAFVQMETNEQAMRSIEALHGTMVRSQNPYHEAAAVHACQGDMHATPMGPGSLQAALTGVHPLC